jgi:hypothetical protein
MERIPAGHGGYGFKSGWHNFWKGMRTAVQLLDAPYVKGVKVCGNEKTQLEHRLQRSPVLHWWGITIYPNLVF